MSAHHKFKTDILVTLAGVEHEWPATITYTRHKGYQGSRVDPPEDDSVEVLFVHMIVAGGSQLMLPNPMADKFNDNPQIIAMLHDDWRDDEIAAAEYRAEARRECL